MDQINLNNFSSGRVALFVPSMKGGGAEKAMINLASGFISRGLQVDLILFEKVGPYLESIPSEVRIIDLADPSQSVASVLPLRKYLRQVQPDFVIAALKESCMVLLLAKLLGIGDVRIVVTQHGVIWAPEKGFFRCLGRSFMYRWANEIVAVSSGVAEDFARSSFMPRSRVKVIYNGISVSQLQQKASEPVEHEWFRSKEIPVIVSAGRLVKEKGHETLIRAFALIRKNRLARLAILGEGPELNQLRDLTERLGIQEDVLFLGFKTNPYAYMARSSVFVLSSTVEGLPNVIVEAMTVGTPVVSTDCKSGPREILDDGKYGMLVPVGDAEGLAIAIEKQLDEPTDKKLLLERAQDFSLKKVIDQFLEVAGFGL
jgi:glycosyltransferase involved in cell wall biosynthesis